MVLLKIHITNKVRLCELSEPQSEPFVGQARHFKNHGKYRYKSKKRWFSVEDFKMDDRAGKLICPAGHSLYIKNRKKLCDGAGIAGD